MTRDCKLTVLFLLRNEPYSYCFVAILAIIFKSHFSKRANGVLRTPFIRSFVYLFGF